jgi:hypothetical protein
MDRGNAGFRGEVLLSRVNNRTFMLSWHIHVYLSVRRVSVIRSRAIGRVGNSTWRRWIVILRWIRAGMRRRGPHLLAWMMCELNGGLTVVSGIAIVNIFGDVRPSVALTPTHESVEMLLLIHRMRSMYLCVEAQRRGVASTN